MEYKLKYRKISKNRNRKNANEIVKTTLVYLFISLLLVSSTVQSQTKVVSGHVYAFKNLALKNIKVKSKKTNAVVSTDSLGNFTIVCDEKDKLQFSGGGFVSYVKSVKKKQHIDLKMVFKEGGKNEEIAIGYGHVSEAQLTSSIAKYGDYNNDYGNYTDIFDLIQGKFAGVQVVNNGGSKHIVVRGISSPSSDNYAIYIVDGVPVYSIDYIVPSNVKKISVIKDGDATYGSRGGNGVVLITTIGAKGN